MKICVVILFISYPGLPCLATCPTADLTDDCFVDFADFAVLASQWLQPPGDPSADIAPNGGDGIVNFLDFSVLAKDWGQDLFAYSALTAARSGFEVMRYWLENVVIPGSSGPSAKVQSVASTLQSEFSAAGVSNISATYNAGNNTITIPIVTLDNVSGQNFSAVISQVGLNTLRATITGTYHQASKQVTVDFDCVTLGNSVFNFGVATKGPLNMVSGGIEGVNVLVNSCVYIESQNSILALEMIGKSSIAGDVSIVNPLAVVDIDNSSSIAGESGADAQDHVFFGVPPSEFPTPNPDEFAPFVQNTFIPGTTPTSNVTLQNIRIPSNANPNFSGNVIINGVMFIEPPNAITFNGNTQITGVIVANGSLDAPSSANSLQFLGTVDSHNVNQLPDEGFAELKKKQGTFLMAAGFSVAFGGNLGTINGVIAASGVEFYGQAGGTINGSVINYALTPIKLASTGGLYLHRSGVDPYPAGFSPHQILRFMPNTYTEYGEGLEFSTAEFLIEQIWELTAMKCYNDLPAYDGISYQPPINANGEVLNDFADYSQQITVVNVSDANFTSIKPDNTTNFAKVTVAVYLNNEKLSSASWIRARY